MLQNFQLNQTAIGGQLSDYVDILHPPVVMHWVKMSTFLHSNFIIVVHSVGEEEQKSITLKGAYDVGENLLSLKNVFKIRCHFALSVKPVTKHYHTSSSNII